MKILLKDSDLNDDLKTFAEKLNLDIVYNDAEVESLALSYSTDGVALLQRNGRRLIKTCADFIAGSAAHRRRFGGGRGQTIAKAAGLSKGFVPSILDATAGLGRDAFVLASLGATVTMLERSPIVHALLEDGLARAKVFAEEQADGELLDIIGRMTLVNSDSFDYMQTDNTYFDVVFLDPMFPERKKTALVKKEMRAFHSVVGQDEDADHLLDKALHISRYRVVVKRPRIAPFLAGKKPSYQLEGKSSRFDIYTLKALPI
ncbi:class I SAM-dependent methyltransferase [Agarilytica rhodophyticola]|uniref:class I SAM-dependent methyltransferase n=1 Tax=Agarilytica rhodophyticola TaxID=1737490 RepID=UPI000B345F9C|nr:class I SAM-dependent methyltransferase [Agarilytica rhodophyticola]